MRSTADNTGARAAQVASDEPESSIDLDFVVDAMENAMQINPAP